MLYVGFLTGNKTAIRKYWNPSTFDALKNSMRFHAVWETEGKNVVKEWQHKDFKVNNTRKPGQYPWETFRARFKND